MFVKKLSSFKLGNKSAKFNYFDTCCAVASLNTETMHVVKKYVLRRISEFTCTGLARDFYTQNRT